MPSYPALDLVKKPITLSFLHSAQNDVIITRIMAYDWEAWEKLKAEFERSEMVNTATASLRGSLKYWRWRVRKLLKSTDQEFWKLWTELDCLEKISQTRK